MGIGIQKLHLCAIIETQMPMIMKPWNEFSYPFVLTGIFLCDFEPQQSYYNGTSGSHTDSSSTCHNITSKDGKELHQDYLGQYTGVCTMGANILSKLNGNFLKKNMAFF